MALTAAEKRKNQLLLSLHAFIYGQTLSMKEVAD